METRHFIKTLCKQKVKTFYLSTLIALNPKWVPRLMETRHFIKTLCKQKVKTFYLSTLIALNPKWVPCLVTPFCSRPRL